MARRQDKCPGGHHRSPPVEEVVYPGTHAFECYLSEGLADSWAQHVTPLDNGIGERTGQKVRKSNKVFYS